MIRRSGLLAEKSNYPNGEPKYSPRKIEGQKELSFPCKMFISDLLDWNPHFIGLNVKWNADLREISRKILVLHAQIATE